MVNIHSSVQKASKPLSSVLKAKATTQHSTLKTILKDVSKAHPDMTRSEHLRLSKTIKKLGDDPTHVVSRKQKKIALKALDAAGHLKHKYAKHLGAAIRELDAHSVDPKEETLAQLKEKRPSELTKEERRELKKRENRLKARAAQEREASEGKFHEGNHKTTRIGLEQLQGASVSANSSQRRQSDYQLQGEDDKKKKKRDDIDEPEIVEMMLD